MTNVIDFPYRKPTGADGQEVGSIEYIVALLAGHVGHEFNAVLVLQDYTMNEVAVYPIGYDYDEMKHVLAKALQVQK